MSNSMYPKHALRDALEHLASIDLLELCNEAKIERCRATRDLSSCGRNVQDVLNSCGHASLCAECSKRCDVCPICRSSLPVNGNRLRPRLYYECIDAGLIPKRHADRFQEKDDSKDHMLAIQRLYSLFDVALDNNLVSLICHYITDVCMDENAVSSDPVLSFLLDEVVVKDWCKQRFKGIIHDLQTTYRLDLEGMKSKLRFLQKLASQLRGISIVLEVMVSSFKDNVSAQLNDLHFLLNSTLKTKQHLEIMMWCIQHEFLENVQSCYPDYQSWASHVHERKLAAINQAWPNSSSYLAYSGDQSEPALFIEQALSNLEIEECDGDKHDEIDIFCLQDTNSRVNFTSKIDEPFRNDSSVCYPFKNLRAAADIIFLHGASDMVVAKRAIFLYYLFDRHWTLPDAEWKFIVEDFASTFDINRLPLLESFVFYLLDNHTDNALQEACTFLPQIAGPDTHPKVAQVLLERKRSDVALTVLRCTGRDGFSGYDSSVDEEGKIVDEGKFVSLEEALTVLRVRTECGLLTEAFMCLRKYCHYLKESTAKQQDLLSSNNLKSDLNIHMEILVTEMCLICIRMHLVDRMIEFPWDSTEEIYIHKCLLEDARQRPSVNGSLLTVFYLQRYRYVEAFQVHRQLQSLEQGFLENLNGDDASQMKSISLWRSTLVEKALDLLPEIVRQQVMSESSAETDIAFSQDDQMEVESASEAQLEPHANISTSFRKSQSLVLRTHLNNFPSKKDSVETSTKPHGHAGNANMDISRVTPFQQRHFNTVGSPQNGSRAMALKELNTSPFGQSFSGFNGSQTRRSNDSARRFDVTSVSNNHSSLKTEIHDQHPMSSQSFSVFNGSQTRRSNDSARRFDVMSVSNNHSFLKTEIHDQHPMSSAKQNYSYPITSKDSTQNVWSDGKRDSLTELSSLKVGSRWRSDESSEDEADRIDKHLGGPLFTRKQTRRFRRR